MSRAITPQLAAILASDHAEYWMLDITLPSGTVSFWEGRRPWVWSGRTYQPGGIIEIGDIEEAEGAEARSMTLSLRAAPDAGLSPDRLAALDVENYRLAPVVRRVAIFDKSGVFAGVIDEYDGFIDYVDEEESVEDGSYRLTASCTSRAFAFWRASPNRRTTTDHGRWSAGDRFFSMVDKAQTEKLDVGRKTS